MVGKANKSQRGKNVTKPSSSARSAELLAFTVPPSAGFITNLNVNIGFGNSDSILETCPNAEYQIIFRKLYKKDPLTKKKAMQELIDVINSVDLEQSKLILSIWLKFYETLASDVEHDVREQSQMVLYLLVTKTKRALAPYLKQLVPIWLANQFDKYAPAGSIACTSFYETFAGKVGRLEKVCQLYHVEIFDFTIKSLTTYSLKKLQNTTDDTDGTEQDYSRKIIASLKILSFFLEYTNGNRNDDGNKDNYGLQENLLAQQKFWDLGTKIKDPAIISPWFEFLSKLLENNVLDNNTIAKIQTICFNNVSCSDTIVAEQIWKCILSLQLRVQSDNLYKAINGNKLFLPTQSIVKAKGTAISTNLLQIFLEVSKNYAIANNSIEFHQDYLADIRKILLTENNLSNINNFIFIESFFKHLFYLLNNLSETAQNDSAKNDVIELIKLNMIKIMEFFFLSEKEFLLNYIAKKITMLTTSLDNRDINEKNSHLNVILNSIPLKTTETAFAEKFYIKYIEIVILLLKNFNIAANNIGNKNGQLFSFNELNSALNKYKMDINNQKAQNSDFIQNATKDIVIEVVNLGFKVAQSKKSPTCLMQIPRLVIEGTNFYNRLIEDKVLYDILHKYFDVVKEINAEEYPSIFDGYFKILHELKAEDSANYIKCHLLQVELPSFQIVLLEQLFSYPFYAQLKIRQIYSDHHIKKIILNLARDVLHAQDTKKLHLLYKCLFHNNSDTILIDQSIIDEVLMIITEPFENDKYVNEIFSTFVVNIVSIIFNGNVSSSTVKREVFLRLFKYTIAQCKNNTSDNENSEKNIWQITNCWQNALLKCNDASLLCKSLLETCSNTIRHFMLSKDLTQFHIEYLINVTEKLLYCATKNSKLIIKDDYNQDIAAIVKMILNLNYDATNDICAIKEFCTFLEVLKGQVSSSNEIQQPHIQLSNMKLIKNVAYQTYLEMKIISKLIVKKPFATSCANDENFDVVLIDETIKCFHVAAIAKSLLNNNKEMDSEIESVIKKLLDVTDEIIHLNNHQIYSIIYEKLLNGMIKESDTNLCRVLTLLINHFNSHQHFGNTLESLGEDLTERLMTANSFKAYLNCMQFFSPKLKPDSILADITMLDNIKNDIWLKAALLRNMIVNNYFNKYSESTERYLIQASIVFIGNIYTQNRELVHCKRTMTSESYDRMRDIIEYIYLLTEVITKFPFDLKSEHWEIYFIGLSSWALTTLKSIEFFKAPMIAVFVVAVFKLFRSIVNFIKSGVKNSSTKTLVDATAEWQHVFSKDINIILFQSFHKLYTAQDQNFEGLDYNMNVLNEILPVLEVIQYDYIYEFCKTSTILPLNEVIDLLINGLPSFSHTIATTCTYIIKQLSICYVKDETKVLQVDDDSPNVNNNGQTIKSHYLSKFENLLERYNQLIDLYIREFSFKLNEILDLEPVDPSISMGYLLMWDCIIHACANSPVSLRSIYTNWLSDFKYEENLLLFLFRAMPIDVLKNYDSRNFNCDLFRSLNWTQIKDRNLSVERYVCHMYTEVLRSLPAMVRKWWNTSQTRQKVFVDKLTTNFVSPFICNEELRLIAAQKEKHENMQISVHVSSREVLAVYLIDEARMELLITLARNYPLGSVKVECGKQIGGRTSSRNLGMQLTIFLTHQNGNIFDGLTLWKNNLDKKFEGVEECYVCYTVIHQETCQLPKLTCRTCKKKFHGPCLYKWFTTSSKSTCPICRNVF